VLGVDVQRRAPNRVLDAERHDVRRNVRRGYCDDHWIVRWRGQLRGHVEARVRSVSVRRDGVQDDLCERE
jgi:hypothetical protein